MKLKRIIYLIVSICIGILMSYIAHALLEIWQLTKMEEKGYQVAWYDHFGVGVCALPPYLQYGIFVLGILGGLFLGFWGWRIVYVEKRRWKFRKDPNRKP